jgi:adenylosuccinate synthase
MSGIEALKDNELIPGMNKFIDHIHHLTMENKRLKEQLKDQDQMFTNEKDDLIAQLDHSHYHYDKLKEQLKKEKSVGDDITDIGLCYRKENAKLKERIIDLETQINSLQYHNQKEKESKDFYEKMFTDLRSTLVHHQNK